jgi:hypothetical protein
VYLVRGFEISENFNPNTILTTLREETKTVKIELKFKEK